MTKMTNAQRAVRSESIKRAHEARREIGGATRSAVVAVLTDAKQPLVAREVQVLLAGRKIVLNESYVKELLDKLVADRLIATRLETAKEKAIRKGADRRGNHFQTSYYWAPAGKVPARTEGRLVQTDSVASRSAKKFARKAARKKSRRPAGVVAVQTGGSSEKLISQLLNRVSELESQLADVRKAAR